MFKRKEPSIDSWFEAPTSLQPHNFFCRRPGEMAKSQFDKSQDRQVLLSPGDPKTEVEVTVVGREVIAERTPEEVRVTEVERTAPQHATGTGSLFVRRVVTIPAPLVHVPVHVTQPAATRANTATRQRFCLGSPPRKQIQPNCRTAKTANQHTPGPT